MTEPATTSAATDAIAQALAVVLGQSAATERVTRAAVAAEVVVARYVDPIAYAELGDAEAVLTPLEDPQTFEGLVAIAQRIYQDPSSPAGILASDSYTGVFVPEDLLTHVRHYFDHRRVRGAWGIA